MRIVHIATIDRGGAYNAARRLNEMFRCHGVESKILVRTKTGDDTDVIPVFDSKLQEIISKGKNVINILYKRGEVKRDVLGSDISANRYVEEADVIFIHWISTFLSPGEIYKLSKLPDKKVIFVMHDMWLFTGGCHVDKRCGGYEYRCMECPLLHPNGRLNQGYSGRAAHRSFMKKAGYIQNADMTVTGPSRWIVKEANKSAVLKGKKAVYMPNVLDTDIFRPAESRAGLREKYGIDPDKKVILFAAADTGTGNEYKGFRYLKEALDKIDRDNILLAVMGNTDGRDEIYSRYDSKMFGYVKDEDKLAEIYSLADVYVNPSMQESFGYTVCESMACGTPAVAFAVGGMLDQIVHKDNGYLAGYQSSKDLAEGIEYVLQNRNEMSQRARRSAERYSYHSAYDEVISVIES